MKIIINDAENSFRPFSITFTIESESDAIAILGITNPSFANIRDEAKNYTIKHISDNSLTKIHNLCNELSSILKSKGII